MENVANENKIAPNKSLITFVLAGPKNSGKTTIATKLILKYKSPMLKIPKINKDLENAKLYRGDETLLFDRTKLERIHKHTLLNKKFIFETNDFRFGLTDTPGCNIIKTDIGMNRRDALVYVVSCENYSSNFGDDLSENIIEYKQNLCKLSYMNTIYAHLSSAFEKGIKDVIVVINKMDLFSSSEKLSQEVFNLIKNKISKMMHKIGSGEFRPRFILTSAKNEINLYDDNIDLNYSAISRKMNINLLYNWSEKQSLVYLIKKVPPRSDIPTEIKTKFLITQFFRYKKDETIIIGLVLSGEIRVGDHIGESEEHASYCNEILEIQRIYESVPEASVADGSIEIAIRVKNSKTRKLVEGNVINVIAKIINKKRKKLH